MTFSSTFQGTTCSISSRKTSRLVFFLLPAYSASEKLSWLIVSIPLPSSTSHDMIGGLVQTFPNAGQIAHGDDLSDIRQAFHGSAARDAVRVSWVCHLPSS